MYLESFHNTNLLSLDNFTRYSKEFCLYTKSLFGPDICSEEMGPYNYMNVISFYFNLCLGMMRTCSSQTSTILQGKGSNGKTNFVEKVIVPTFTSKKVNKISGSVFFSNSPTNQQTIDIQESLIQYENEGNTVDLQGFKDKVSGGSLLSRQIYKTMDRDNNFILSHILICLNEHLKYTENVQTQTNKYKFDEAFLRRIFLVVLRNKFGSQVSKNKNHETLLTKNNFNLSDSKVISNIISGFSFYCIDIIHVFDIGHLNSEINDYLVQPVANKRITGKGNYKILQRLLAKYVPFGEFCLSEPERTPVINFSNFLKEEVRDLEQPIDYASIMDTLKMFNLNLQQSASNADDFYSENISYVIGGLVLKQNLNNEQKKIWNEPHKNHLWDKTKTRSDYETDEEFVCASIPCDLVFDANKFFKPKFFQVLSNLISGEKVSPQAVPILSPEYKVFGEEQIYKCIDNCFV